MNSQDQNAGSSNHNISPIRQQHAPMLVPVRESSAPEESGEKNSSEPVYLAEPQYISQPESQKSQDVKRGHRSSPAQVAVPPKTHVHKEFKHCQRLKVGPGDLEDFAFLKSMRLGKGSDTESSSLSARQILLRNLQFSKERGEMSAICTGQTPRSSPGGSVQGFMQRTSG